MAAQPPRYHRSAVEVARTYLSRNGGLRRSVRAQGESRKRRCAHCTSKGAVPQKTVGSCWHVVRVGVCERVYLRRARESGAAESRHDEGGLAMSHRKLGEGREAEGVSVAGQTATFVAGEFPADFTSVGLFSRGSRC